MAKKLLLIIFGAVLMMGVISFSTLNSYGDTTDRFLDSDWSGGESADYAVHPDNKTGWNKYSSASDKVNAQVPGKVFLDTEKFELKDTTDTDFNKGVKEGLLVTGSGDEASLQVEPGLSDPFVDNLGKWVGLNEMPALGSFSAYVKIGSYVYAFWERNIFGRYSIAGGNWDFMADAPGSTGPGCALAYPGSGDFIYALRGGTQKTFWRYSISTDTWTSLSDTLYPIQEGGSLAATSTLIFCAAGRSAKFLEYNIASNTWVERPDIYGGWNPTRQGQIVYPGGNYVYLAQQGDSANFAAYHITKQRWDDYKPPNGPNGLADLCYPGTGDYLYAWHFETNNRFCRFKFQGSGSGAWESLPIIPTYAYRGILVYPGSGSELYLISAGSYSPDIMLKFNTVTLKWNSGTTFGLATGSAHQKPFYGGAMAYDGGDKIYDARGYADTYFYQYSISGDTWTQQASFPFNFYYGGDLAYLDGFVYATRGYSDVGFAKYEVATNTWTNLTSTRPTPATVSYGGSLAAAGGLLYALRGNSTNDFWKYDPSTGWSNVDNPQVGWVNAFSGSGLNDMTTGGVYDNASILINYRVYIDGTGSPNTFRWSDDNGSTWKATAQPITGEDQALNNGVTIRFASTTGHTSGNYWNFNAFRRAPDTVSNGGSLCYPGAGDASEDYLYATRTQNTRTFWKYDLNTGVWSAAPDLPVPIGIKSKLKYPGTGDYLYLIVDNYAYFLRYKFKGTDKGSWEVLPNVPNSYVGNRGVSMEAAGDRVYFEDYNDNQLFYYTISTGEWSKRLEEYSTSRPYYGNIIFTGGDLVYVFSGFQNQTIWKYSLSQDKWLGTINAPFRFTYGTKAVYPGSNGQEGSQNYVYVTEGDLTKRFWRYDLINNVWARITDSPASFYSGAQITGEGDVIYALPGIDYADTTTTEQRSWKFLKYTISTNTWTDAIEHLPDSLYVRNYYELGNRLLYIPSAGAVYYKSGTNNGYFYRYDVERDTWLAETATTNSRNGCLLYLASQNAIYYFSGGANLKFRKYLITDGTWTDLSNPPFGSGYDSVDSDMFYPGGDFIYLSDGCNRSFVRYSISKDDWDLPVMPPSSYCRNYYTVISAGGDGDSIYVGGYDVFYKYSISNRTWTTLVSPYNSAPALRWDQYDPQMVYPGTGSYLYSTRGRTTNNFWRYSVSGNSWEALTAPANSFGSGHQLVGTPSKIYALRGDSYNNFWAYDPSSNTWASSANTPDTVNFGSSLCYVTLAGGGNFIYATRGNRSSDFWRYSLSTDSWESMAPVPVLLGGGYGGTSLVYPGVGDYLYLTQGTIYSTNYGASTVFRYSLANNTWEEARSLCPQVFLDDGQLIYPGSGDYLYGFKGSSRWDFSKFLVFKKGSYISDVKIAGRNQGYDLMSWNSNVNDSTFEFRARSSDNFSMADATEWEDVPVRKKGDDLTASYPYVMDKHKYIQYRLMFFADDLTTIPEISDLTLSYNKYPPAKELVSSAYNSKEANNRIMDISWSQTQPSGSDLRFQLRTAPDDSGEPGAWTPWLGPGGTQTFTDDFSDEAGYAYAPTIEVVNGTAKLKKIYEDYQYTQRITLDNTASTESYLDAIVTIEVDSLNEDFWGHVKSDGSDIRFSDGDGNSLSYSIDSPGTSFDYSVKYAKIKLKIPEIPSGEKTTVYLKYGKADAVSESDPKLMTVPSSGLAGYWTFNEGSGNTVEDFSGNNNNGVLYNSPSWVDGKIGKALSFNGSNTYVDFGNSNSLKITGSQTISMWLKPTDLAARRNPVDKAYGGEGTMTLETSGTISYYYGTSGTNGGSYQSISSAALKAGVWTHIAIVRDLDNMKLRWYINGVKTNEATANYAAAVASGNNLRIGLGYAGAFLGLIDEVAIYNQALSDTEVADLFSGTSSGISIPYCFNLVETSTTSPSLSGWEYREEIRIDNTDGKELKNYQVKVVLDKGSSGFWSRCKSDGYDVRFVDADNATILNYYRQSFDYANHAATLWVKVPLILAGETKSIYLYYGRADAADASSFNNTMVKDFNEKENNVSGISLDGTDEKVSVSSSESLNITDSLTLETLANMGIDYWPQGWLYRKAINIDNTDGPQISNAVVQFDVPYQAEIKNDYSDLAFWEKDHSRKLRYEIMSYDGTKATVRVEIDLPENAAKDIFMYYGNASVVSGSMSVGTVISDIKVASGNNSTDRYVYVDGILRDTTQRSYSVTRLDENGDFVEVKKYDCYGYYDQATAMKTYLSGLPWGTVVIVNTYNEPRNNVYNNSTLIAALTDFGATSSTIQSLQSSGSYILIGWKGAGAGNALVEKSGATNVSVFYDTETEGDLLAAKVCSRAVVFNPQEIESSTLKWLPGFKYRQKMTFSNSAGNNTVNAQVSFNVVYLAGKMNTDYSDLRFVDSDGKILRFRIYGSDSTSAKVFLEIPYFPSGTAKDIYLYYGNAKADSVAIADPSQMQDVPRDGLQYWWKFDEGEGSNTYDCVNNVVSVLNGNYSWVDGKIGKAIKLEGNASIDPSTSVGLNDNNKTLALWFNPSDFSGSKFIAGKSWYTPTRDSYTISLEGSTLKARIVYVAGTSSDAGQYVELSTALPTTNTWYHVALVHDYSNSKMYLYLNGAEVGQADITGYSGGGCQFKFGAYSCYQWTWTFTGLIDQACYYSRALGAQEIKNVYDGVSDPAVNCVMGQEESQPVIDLDVISKPGAYELKFDNEGLSGYINGERVVSSPNYVYNDLAHYAFTYNGQSAKLYVNGVEKANQELAGLVNTNSSLLVIGEGIKGIIDEARVWGRACSSGEIEENQKRRLSPADETSLACYLTFNENSGINASDATANANNGVLQNGAAWVAAPFEYINSLPAALYHMDEGGGTTSADGSGNGNLLTLSGATWSTTDLTGFTGGKSVSFDGFSAYAYAEDSDNLDLTNKISIEAWIRPTDNISNHIILLKGDDSESRFNYRLLQAGNNVSFSFYNSTLHSFTPTSSFITANNIYQIVVTYDQVSGKVLIYSNGQQIYSGVDDTLMLPNSDKLYLGRNTSGSNPFAGMIDEVRVYNRVLSADEVLRHYEHRLYYVNAPIEFNNYEPPVDTSIAAFAVNNPVIQPVFGVFYSDKNIAQFQEIAAKPNNTNIKYQISQDGYSWFWFDGASWGPVEYGYAQANTASELNANLASYLNLYPSGDLYYRAFLHVDAGVFKTPVLDNVGITLKTGDTYYTLPEGAVSINAVHSDAANDQWFQYKVLLYSDGEDTSVLDDATVSYIKSYIKILTPNGAEELPVSTANAQDPSGLTHYDITWQSQAISGVTGGLLKLEYSSDNGGTWNLIQENVPNSGIYSWHVPDLGSHQCRVKITSIDFPAVSDQSDGLFTILALELTKPNGSEAIEQGRAYPITWDLKGTIPNNIVKLELSLDNGSSWSTIADSVPNTKTYNSWIVPTGLSKQSDNALIRISASLDSGVFDTSDAVFAIVPTPALTVTAPAGGESWNVGTTHEISWQANSLQFSNQVIIEYSKDDFVDDAHEIAQVDIGTPAGENPNADITGSYQWSIPLDMEVGENIKIRVKEAEVPAGRQTQQIISGISSAFAIVEPTITLNSPAAGNIWVAGDTHQITWSTEGAVSDNLLFEYKIGADASDPEGWVTMNSLNEDSSPVGEANDGSFDWVVPIEALGDSVYVRITDLDRPQVSGISGAFRVLGGATLAVADPNGGEELTIGTSHTITWQSYGDKLEPGGSDYSMINIYYSVDNGSTWTILTYHTANTKSYLWASVPDLETAQALIKIEDANDPDNIIDVSDAVFKIVPPVITVEAPNGGETYYATGQGEVRWSCVGAISNNLTLRYSVDGGTNWVDIAKNVANTGSYSWDPVADAGTQQAKVRIIDASRTGAPVLDDSNAVFSITPPSITITSPNGAEQLPVGTFCNIAWTTIGHTAGAIRDNLTIQYSSDGGVSWNTVATGVSTTEEEGVYSWQVPNTVSNACLIKIFDATRPATADISNANFRIVLPYVEITSPAAGAQWIIGSVQNITWNSVGAVSEDLTLQYSIDNGNTWKDFNPTATHIANTHSYLWTVPDDLAALVKVRLVDNERPEIFDLSDVFSIVIPVIKVTRPNGSELLTVGDSENIIWNNVGSIGSSLKFEYSKDNFVSDVHQIVPTQVVNNGPNTTGNTAVWVIPEDVSANVRVRIVDNGRPEVWDKSDAAFTILPVPQITITSPVSGDIWRVGDSRDITWSDNGGLISNNLTLEYSTDTGTTWSNIATGVANSKSYTWKVADAVSATCKIRIQDPSRTPATTALSEDTFRIADPLITITAPKGGEKWAVNDIAPVTWTTEGSVSDNLILKYSPDGGSTYYPAKDSDGNIAINVANSGLFYWLVPDNVSSNVIFRIEDGDRPVTFDTSDTTFSIIEVPRFVNIGIGPAGSAKEFVLGDTVDITWKCEGLSISDNLIIDSSNDNFVSSRSVIATGVPNTGKYTWTIPQDALTGSTLKVRITDGNRTAITGKYDGYFRIRGGFTLTSPNGGEHWVSKSPHTITWSTRGNIPRVKLEYTTNDGVSWNSIAASLENAGSYSWILPDIKSDTVKVRVSDPDDGTVADSSDVDFGVNYITVKFNVLDFDTLQHLSDLSVSEPATGWVDTGVDSAITRELVYPYGTYTTFFTKTNYIDNSVTWSPPKEGLDPYVITVYLENSASAQVTWEAILSYSYSPADDILSCVGSLQRKGKLVGLREDERARMGGATFTIYEPDGATIRKVLVASVPNSSGMYTFTYASTDFLSGKVYPATLSITYNEQSYTSTANIDVGAEKLQYEFFTKTAEKLTTSVQAIEEAVAGGTAQTKRDIESAKSDITNSLNSTISDTKTDIESKIENVLQKTDLAMKSEILNNESTIRAGDIMVIRYRTYSGLRPVVDIYNPNNAQVISRALMTEIGSTGIYEYSVRFLRTWGKGPCSVVCSESTKGSLDAMTVEMIDSDMDSISSQVSSILGSTSSISNLKKVADSMSSQFNMLESALSKIGKDMVSQVKKSTGSSEQFNTVFSQLSSMSKQLKAMTGSSGVNLEKLYNVASEKKSDMVYLKNKTQELKAAMEINQKLVDSIAHKTVTQTWYEYR